MNATAREQYTFHPTVILPDSLRRDLDRTFKFDYETGGPPPESARANAYACYMAVIMGDNSGYWPLADALMDAAECADDSYWPWALKREELADLAERTRRLCAECTRRTNKYTDADGVKVIEDVFPDAFAWARMDIRIGPDPLIVWIDGHMPSGIGNGPVGYSLEISSLRALFSPDRRTLWTIQKATPELLTFRESNGRSMAFRRVKLRTLYGLIFNSSNERWDTAYPEYLNEWVKGLLIRQLGDK